MSRTVELGRAVLQSTGAQLQLWLTTLITISPEQATTNLNKLSHAALLELLSSGDVWVRRGNGMHLVLELTVLGEHLDQLNTERLARGIINAPAWQQLKLLPSLPLHDSEHVPDNTLRINVNHARLNLDDQSPGRHRILADVSYADVRPPDGIQTICLQSVHYSMDILKLRGTSSNNPPKRPKHAHLQRKPVNKDAQSDDEHDQLYDVENRPGMPTSRGSDVATSGSSPLRRNGRKLSLSLSFDDLAEKNFRSPDVLLDVGNLVDASIRLSMGYISTRNLKGLNVKVNAFTISLGQICPALWRPAYLQALSQRARLIPNISRSMNGIMNKTGVSTSMNNKFARLANVPRGLDRPADDDYCLRPASERGAVGAIQARLWTGMQRELQAQRIEQLQPFFASDSRIGVRLEASEKDPDLFEAEGAAEHNKETLGGAEYDDLFASFDPEATIASRPLALGRDGKLDDIQQSRRNGTVAATDNDTYYHLQETTRMWMS
ncbi:hypothetical protein BDV96DRAFT_644094 [Lophiotrema nucula]|uniref:Uncharacterized protein n=1 Tax=Lophiotrema nucula TaxID=690887 RepID=A0A6A5ZFP0_9PLEO|nr:hypothetical protein BDV96DRAFT_644094 [Lophiotrema nucula]